MLLFAMPLAVVFAVPNVVCAQSTSRWTELLGSPIDIRHWQSQLIGWQLAGDALLPEENGLGLLSKPGRCVILSAHGNGTDLLSKRRFQDVEVSLEFIIGRNSNSGVKLNGLYEIQIRDTSDAVELTGDVCGGVYPRAEQEPSYHHLDKGVPPRVNAAKPAGQWQSLVIRFRSPRFDASGVRISKAEFVSVLLNGQLIHKHVRLDYPTGAAWRLESEVSRGPLLLQGDHGAVAFRDLRVRE
jgi:hypothetical protein